MVALVVAEMGDLGGGLAVLGHFDHFVKPLTDDKIGIHVDSFGQTPGKLEHWLGKLGADDDLLDGGTLDLRKNQQSV